MDGRLKLQDDLEKTQGLAFDSILNGPAVYFQPPPTVEMVYPCIRYKKDGGRIRHADNNPYKTWKKYLITIIDPNPDSIIPDEVSKLSGVSYVQNYTANGLHHTVYSVYR